MAVKNCATTLGQDILNDCNVQYGSGVEKTYYIISRDNIDWDKSTREGFIVSGIIAVTGKRGYKINNPSTENPAITVTDTNATIGTAFDKVLPVVMLPDSPESAEAVMALKQDKYVVIYENTVKGTNGNQAFVVFGWEQGARGLDLTMDKSGDFQGGWSGNLTETNAPTSQIFFWKTDYATTKAALESLCSAAA